MLPPPCLPDRGGLWGSPADESRSRWQRDRRACIAAWLRDPSAPRVPEWPGFLRLSSPSGSRTYDAAHGRRPYEGWRVEPKNLKRPPQTAKATYVRSVSRCPFRRMRERHSDRGAQRATARAASTGWFPSRAGRAICSRCSGRRMGDTLPNIAQIAYSLHTLAIIEFTTRQDSKLTS